MVCVSRDHDEGMDDPGGAYESVGHADLLTRAQRRSGHLAPLQCHLGRNGQPPP